MKFVHIVINMEYVSVLSLDREGNTKPFMHTIFVIDKKIITTLLIFFQRI